MNTIILFKVIYVEANGLITEADFQEETDARSFAATVSDPVIYKYAIIGQMERIL